MSVVNKSPMKKKKTIHAIELMCYDFLKINNHKQFTKNGANKKKMRNKKTNKIK